jgi:hypothetical protein
MSTEGIKEDLALPPPYENGTAPATTSDTTEPPPTPRTDLLEPSLKLDFSTIEKNLHKSDKAFAREVVKLIAERAENGIFARDCWGYKFLDPPVLPFWVTGSLTTRSRHDRTSRRLDGTISSGSMRTLTVSGLVKLRRLREMISRREELRLRH